MISTDPVTTPPGLAIDVRVLARWMYERLRLVLYLGRLGLAYSVRGCASKRDAFVELLLSALVQNGFEVRRVDRYRKKWPEHTDFRDELVIDRGASELRVFVRHAGNDLYVGFHSFLTVAPGLGPILLGLVCASLAFLSTHDVQPGGTFGTLFALGQVLQMLVVFLVTVFVASGVALGWRVIWIGSVHQRDDHQLLVSGVSVLLEESLATIREAAGEISHPITRREWTGFLKPL